MANQPLVCAIIDPYSSSNLYAPALNQEGFSCIAVLSQAQVTEMIRGSFVRSDFKEILEFDGDLPKMVAHLKQRRVYLIVPGMEMGIELAELLGKEVAGRVCNDPETSALRRHKFDMIEAIRGHGLLAPDQVKSNNLPELLNWATSRNQWPLVLKPADSGGSDRVRLCEHSQDIVAAFLDSMGVRGRQGRIITEMVLQSFLNGTEYIVDTVSYQGQHRVTDIWKYKRLAINGASFVYDYKELMPCHGDVQKILIDYTCSALDAVKLQNGPAHSEVMMTAKGPVMVEINPRLGGSAAPVLNRKCLGRGQLEDMIDVLVDPNAFFATAKEAYVIKRHGLAVYLVTQAKGQTIIPDALEVIRALPSVDNVRLNQPLGALLEKTVDMFTMPGMVELIHEDPEQLWQDYAAIRALEDQGMLYVHKEDLRLKNFS